MGDYWGEQAAAHLEYRAEHEPGRYGPHRPHQVAPVGADVGEAEQERGDHDPELSQYRAAEERFLAHAREDGDEHQIPGSGAVHESWGELLGDAAKHRK